MQCPNDDAELISQTIRRSVGHNGMSITYAQCPQCHGYWLDSFNANYVKTDDIARSFPSTPPKQTTHPVCPVCQVALAPYHGENIPSHIRAWRCPNGDGYFFPQAELFAFKQAQEAKLSYFKLWNIPLPSVASVLLVAIAGVISIGLVATYLQYQARQTTLIQARDMVRFQQTFIAGSSATVALTTIARTDATFHSGDFSQAMESKDHLLHTIFLPNLLPGNYNYYFTFATGGIVYRSDMYSFTIQ